MEQAEFVSLKEKEVKSQKMDNIFRATLFDVIVKAMIEAYGEENVSIVGASEVAVAIGEVELEATGKRVERCAIISPTLCKYKDNRKKKRKFEKYNRWEEEKKYKNTLKEKEDKKKKTAEKAEKDKAKREQEKAANKAE